MGGWRWQVRFGSLLIACDIVLTPAEAVIAWLLCRLASWELEAGQALSQTG